MECCAPQHILTMYKKTSRHYQSRADGIRKTDLIEYDDELTDDEKIDFLRKKLADMEDRIRRNVVPAKDRKQFERVKGLMQEELRKLKLNRRPGIEKFFVDAARRILVPELFEACLEEAKRSAAIHNNVDVK